jgi:hypothetical protein
MSSWRDDLPPIPTERIRAEAIREGTRRRERRAQRQRAVLVSGVSAAAVALLVLSGVLTGTGNNEDAADTADTSAADATTPARPTAPATGAAAMTEAPAGTDAPVGTDAPAATVPPDTAASDTTTPVVDYTTIGGTTALLPPSGEVSVDPAEIFEQGPSGPACGPSFLVVTFQPRGQALDAPTVHWETRGVTGEGPLAFEGDVGRATIGPFAPETLDVGVSYEVLVYVTGVDSSGDVQVFRSPPVVLRDCSP